MAFKVGDAVFTRSGQPALVRDRSKTNGQLVVDTELPAVKEGMRHGYLNGLDPTLRDELYQVLDEVRGASEDLTDPRERVEALKLKVEELEKDPTRQQLTRYVKAEMVHLMNTHGIKPREFTIPETKAK